MTALLRWLKGLFANKLQVKMISKDLHAEALALAEQAKNLHDMTQEQIDGLKVAMTLLGLEVGALQNTQDKLKSFQS